MFFIIDLALVILAATLGSGLAKLCGLPAIAGYIFGGLLISPFTWGPSITDAHQFDEMAEIGILLLMFSIGTEFSPRELASVSKIALLGAPLAVAFFMILGVGVGYWWGLSLLSGVILGAILSVASTMVLARLLMDRGEISSEHGRITLGLSLVEDLIVVIFSVLIPVLGNWTPQYAINLGLSLGKAFLILAPIFFLSFFAIPRFLEWVAAKCDAELLLVVTMTLCIGAAAITGFFGLSLALGAFVAGLLISSSSAGRTAVFQLQGTRDLCVAIAFVSVGALIKPQIWWHESGLLFTVLGFIVIGKFVVWFGVIQLFGVPFRTAAKSALLLSQIGEFSFILAELARKANLISEKLYNVILAAALFSILINTILVRLLMGRCEKNHS